MWSRYPKNGQPSYEVSSAGDKRFSAMWARLADGRTIEQAYQLDVKGYRAEGNDWRLGKGKEPINGLTRSELWQAYLDLWYQWAKENKPLLVELEVLSRGKVLTDKFATSEISQARAWSDIIDDYRLALLFGDGDEFPG